MRARMLALDTRNSAGWIAKLTTKGSGEPRGGGEEARLSESTASVTEKRNETTIQAR